MFSKSVHFPKKIVSLFLLPGFLIFSPGLYCQRPDLQFQKYTIEQGLAQSSVFCILQDQKGFMWFGTEQGLNRFDGYNFVVHKFQYNNPNSLNNSYILSIHEDSSGTFWIGTSGGGLNRFEPETGQFTHYLIDPESPDSLSNIIHVIFEDRSGELWIGTGGGGLKKFDRKGKKFTHFPVNTGDADDADDIGHNTINALCEDDSGILRIGTDGGLKRLDRERNRVIDAASPAAQKVLALYRDRTGELWIGTDNGFYQFDRKNNEFLHYQLPAGEKGRGSANLVRTFYEDRLGTFWIGTEYGLHIFDRQEKRYHSFYTDSENSHGLSNNRVKAIFEDRSGALWVGVNGGALNKLNRTEHMFKKYNSNPGNSDSPTVFAIHEDRDRVLWIGTYGDGLIALNRATGESTNYRNDPENPNSLSDNKIWALCEDRQGILWIGTAEKGLNRLNRKTGRFTRYQHHPQNPNSLCNDVISSIIQDREGILWIATNGGLNKFDPAKNQFVHYQTKPRNPNTLVHNNIYILHEDRLGMLWIGTKGGLSIFDPKSERFTSYRIDPRNATAVIQHPIYSFCEDSQARMWIGTTGGLYRFHREKDTISLYTEKDGLPNDVIYGILEDDRGNLWLSTNKGLSKFNPGTETFKNYSVVDGLQSYEFSGGCCYKSRGGELFFGGIHGFNAFFPDTVKDNPYIPPVVITDFKIFNQPVPIGKEFKGRIILEKSITAEDAITLTHKDHTFSIEFAALNYIHSENNEYAYMMENIEKSWNYAGQRRFVTYANLAPGDYIFRVKASNNHGVWNEQGVSLKIKIMPPLWATGWFRIALIFVLLFLVFAAYRVRTRLILRRNKELEDMVARRTTALKEAGEKYRTVVERAHSGIAIAQDDLIVFKNDRFARLLGYDETDIIDGPLVQFVAPEKQPDMDHLLALSRDEQKLNGNFETILRHKNGQDIHVEVNCGSIKYRKRPALLMFFHDIRMQKLLEEERMKTAKLESTRILVGGIAHDFNNLLSIIIGNIELALSDTTPGNIIHKALTDAEKASMKAVALIRQFISLSQDNTPIKKTTFIQDIIRAAVHSVLADSEVTCHFHLPDDLWPVDCDTNQIKQAIQNIVINSKQAMRHSGGSVNVDPVLEVRAQNEELEADQVPNKRKGKYVCISIKDNGIGIPKQDLLKIFDPYFSTRKDVTEKGLGLGLTAVHSIIRSHEGIIQVNSDVGIGTSVRICLPASKKFPGQGSMG